MDSRGVVSYSYSYSVAVEEGNLPHRCCLLFVVDKMLPSLLILIGYSTVTVSNKQPKKWADADAWRWE